MSEESDKLIGVEKICESCWNPIKIGTPLSWRRTASPSDVQDYSYYHTSCLVELEGN